MGKSASGKDHIYARLAAHEGLGLKKLVLYTTRPIRAEEENGKQYYFVDDKKLEEFRSSGNLIEARAYHTVHGIWNYFTADDGQVDLKNSDYLGIGTLESYVKMREYYGKETVCPVYIEVEDGERLARALKRERGQEIPRYEEMCRRFLADQEDFSEETSKIFLNLGIFSLLIALWSLNQCGFLQFLVPDGRTLYFIDFFTFYLFPVPFNFLLYDICKSKFQKGALFLSVSYLINMGAAVLLQCMGIVDIFLILPITHLIMFVNAAYTIGLIHYEAKQLGNELARKFRYPMYLIMCFSLSELLVYYIRRFQQTSIFLPLGTLLFILMLIWIQVSQYYEQCIQKQKLIYFQKLANIDMLTEAMNRNAYENMIRYLDEQELELHTTGVVLLDLDNLKEINDNFGHEKGDEALKLCYQCIRQAFPSEQNCFRIGGDEFAYIFHKDEKELIADKIHKLELLLNEKDQDLSYSLSVSS